MSLNIGDRREIIWFLLSWVPSLWDIGTYQPFPEATENDIPTKSQFVGLTEVVSVSNENPESVLMADINSSNASSVSTIL